MSTEAQKKKKKTSRQKRTRKSVYCSRVGIPINVEGNHWICAICDLADGTIHFLDSLASQNYAQTHGVFKQVQTPTGIFISFKSDPTADPTLPQLIQEFINFYCLGYQDFVAESFECRKTIYNGVEETTLTRLYNAPPTQTDLYNCGVYMLRTFRCLIDQSQFDAPQNQKEYANKLRLRLKEELENNKLLPDKVVIKLE